MVVEFLECCSKQLIFDNLEHPSKPSENQKEWEWKDTRPLDRKKEMMPDNRQVTFKVVFEEPRAGPVPLFSNHVGISRAGTEVQFEFAFLDINAVATLLQRQKEHSDTSPVEINGKSVAKIVVPLHVFLQLREHLRGLFASIEHDLQLAQQEEENEPSSSVSDVQVVSGGRDG